MSQPPIVSGDPNDWQRPNQPPVMPANQPHYPGQDPPAPPKKGHTTRNVLLIILAAFVGICLTSVIAAAVSGGKKPASTTAVTRTTAPAASPTVAKVTTYNSPAQVIDALNQAGLSCGPEKAVSNPASGAFTMSQCGQNLVISSYANPAAAAASRDTLSAVMKDSGFAGFAVTFGNWLINAGHDQAYAQKVADLFHGTVTPIGGAKPSPSGPPPPPPAPTIGEGTYTVGTDFPAGKYRVVGAGSSCYWEITKSGSNGGDIVDNHLGGGNLTVVLSAGQDFTTERCGTWTKVG